MKRGQVAIEFLVFAGFAIIMILSMLMIISGFSTQKTDEKTYNEIDDFGISLQRELILASEMENGYIRNLNIPSSLNGRQFNMTIGNTSTYTGYLTINYHNIEYFYVIPLVNGTLIKGDNIIRKINDTIYIN